MRWELTPGTPSYAHYLLNRDEAITQAISYEYAAESVEVDPPDWVERTSADPRNGSNGD